MSIRWTTFIILLLAVPAWAGFSLDVVNGYNGRQRPGRLNPLFITLSNDTPVQISIDIAVDRKIGVRRMVAGGPAKSTFVIYVPIDDGGSEITLTATDANSGITLAKWPNEKTPQPSLEASSAVDFFVLNAGQSQPMQVFTRRDNSPAVVQHVRESFLPTTPIGYDAIDVLCLNDPQWNLITLEQQRAMVRWVDAGGVLLLWPGAQGPPPGSPIAQILPAAAGPMVAQVIDAKTRERFGLPDRFNQLSLRTYQPADHTAMVPVLDTLRAPVGRLGLGRVVLLPIDATQLQFKSFIDLRNFWNEILNPVLGADDPGVNNSWQRNHRADTAQRLSLDEIGNLPNVGAFSFNYVLATIGGLLLLVGPVDYFVLKKLHRQPWTWITTSICIALVTAGALYAGRFVQSGDLHFRTRQVFDQAGDHIVGHDEVALIYAPRSETYNLLSATGSWWWPLSQNGVSSGPMGPVSNFQQDGTGNSPRPMWIDVWNWQFLIGRSYEPMPAIVEARLRVENGRLIGTIQNRSSSAVIVHGVMCPQGASNINAQIYPGTVAQVNADFSANPIPFPAADLNPARSDGFTRPTLAGFAPTGTLYATLMDVPADFKLDHSNIYEQHSALLRALVELGQ